MITIDDLKRICPQAKVERMAVFVDALNAAMDEYGISENVERETAFIAQLAHESGGFHYVRELWGPTPAQQGYEGRADLGNTQAGDGKRYMGRGLIQVTGRANYVKCGEALGLDLISQPELLEQPLHACRSAAWFWDSRGLNQLADVGDFLRITRRINGGTNGLADRQAYFERAKTVLA